MFRGHVVECFWEHGGNVCSRICEDDRTQPRQNPRVCFSPSMPISTSDNTLLSDMKTRTTNQLELSLPTQSLKRTLAASLTEVSLDYKTIGTVQMLVPQELPPKRKGIRGKQRPRSRKLAEMEELTPILGLASLLTECEPRVHPCTPDSASSSSTELGASKRRCISHFRMRKSLPQKSTPLKKFSPRPLSRAATHAAIAYFIWSQKQPSNGHANCCILP